MAVAFKAPPSWGDNEASLWTKQIDQLRARVMSWTGNPVQIVDVSYAEWVGRRPGEGLWAEIEQDAIDVTPSLLPGNRSRAES